MPVRAAAQRLGVPFLILLSALLIVLGKADILVVDRARMAVADAMLPVLDLVARPIETATQMLQKLEAAGALYQENQRLREENARLLQWQEVARRMVTENGQLRGLLKFPEDNPVTFVTARVVAESGGAFARNLLVNAGARDQVARGQVALAGEGLVGRVSEVGTRSARVLLLTDLNSRIPVVIDGSRERAVLAGDNSSRPQLTYLSSKAEVKIGDRIVTSGRGGLFPSDLPIGQVVSVEGSVVRVELYVDLGRLDFIRIIDYGLDGVLPQSAMPQPKPARQGKGAAADPAR